MSSDAFREQLRKLVAKHGTAVIRNEALFRGLLRDYCNGYPAESRILLSSLSEGIPERLLAPPSPGCPRKALTGQLVKTLEERLSMTREGAEWAVATWESVLLPPEAENGAGCAARAIPAIRTDEPGPAGRVLSGHREAVFGLAVSGDGRTLVSGGQDHTIRFWSLATCEPEALIEAGAQVRAIALSPDGKTLASAGAPDHGIELWSTATGAKVTTLKGHGSWVESLAFSADGRTLASAAQDDTVRLWPLASGGAPRTWSGHSEYLLGVALSRDGHYVAACGKLGTSLWSAATGDPLATLEGGGCRVAFSPDGRILARAGNLSATINLFLLPGCAPLRTIATGGSDVRSLAFSPDGRTLATSNSRGQVQLWAVATGEMLWTLEGHGGGVVFQVAFSPDGRRLLSAGGDGSIRMWSLEDLGAPLVPAQLVAQGPPAPRLDRIAAAAAAPAKKPPAPAPEPPSLLGKAAIGLGFLAGGAIFLLGVWAVFSGWMWRHLSGAWTGLMAGDFSGALTIGLPAVAVYILVMSMRRR